MPLTKTHVSQLYVSIFGRASEGEGNTYWRTDQADIIATADVMLGTEAAQTYFGSTLNDNQLFIEHIYLNTLGKTYAEDQSGVDYWVNELVTKSKGEVVSALISAAQDSANAGPAQDRFNNKVAVSDYTADSLEKLTDLATFTGFIENVTDDDSTVTAAQSAVDAVVESQTAGNTYSLILTTAIDRVVGDPGNDLILGLDTTYNAQDTIDGGDGNDTLSLILFDAVGDAVAVSNVENVVIRNAKASTDLDAGGWTGVASLTFEQSTTQTVVSNIQEKLLVALKENNNNISVSYADDVLGGASVSQSLSVTDSDATVAIKSGGADKITSLSVEAAGDNVLTIAENDLTSLSLAGSGNVTLFSTAESGKITRIATVSAAESTGDLTLDLSEIDLTDSVDYFVTVTTGSGDDTIITSINDDKINTGVGDDEVLVTGNLDKRDLIAAGDGVDTLTMTTSVFTATAADTEVLSILSGFERIALADEFDADSAIDLSVYGVNYVTIQQGLAGEAELAGLSSGATLEIQTDASETDVLVLSLNGATDVNSDSDSLNVFFNADLEADDDIYETALDVKGVNVISVTTADSSSIGESAGEQTLPDSSDGYKLILTNDGNVGTLNVSGTQAFSFSTSSSSVIGSIIATDMSGNMTLDLNSAMGGAQGVIISTGSGDDLITASAYSDVIAAGNGDDTIIITTGADMIAGGAGSDLFTIDAAGISIVTAYSKISDFSAVSDTELADKIANVSSAISTDVAALDVSAAEEDGGAGMTIIADLVDGIVSLSGSEALEIDTFNEWIDVIFLACEEGKTAGFEFSGNTYIVEESSSGGSIDSLLELTGLTSIRALATSAASDTVIITS
ncbi:MAG: hypothetical protein KQH63_20935 [Desulfobulbaceae bacterium]|nr:hypothetical protein [Desulfobulbaceae bacterium]